MKGAKYILFFKEINKTGKYKERLDTMAYGYSHQLEEKCVFECVFVVFFSKQKCPFHVPFKIDQKLKVKVENDAE